MISTSSDTHIKLVLVNGNGPALVLPKHFALCQRPVLDVYHLRMAPLEHMVPVEPDDCVLDHDCKGSLSECVNMVEAIEPDLIYAQDNGLYNVQIAPHLKIAFPNIPFIYEPYDTISSIYSNPNLMVADGRSKDDVAFNISLERYLFSVSDGVVHNDDGPQIRQLITEVNARELLMQAYVDKDELHYYERTETSKPIRLVWAGGVAPTSAPDETRGENKLLPFFKELIHVGFEVSVYVALARNYEQLCQEYPDYLEFAEKTEQFKIFPYLPRAQLIKKISQESDYGLHVFPRPPSDEGRLAMYQSSMASKVVTYLAAGLPIITACHLEPIARFVSRYNVGLIVKGDIIPGILNCTNEVEYVTLKDNIKNLQPFLTSQSFTHKLEKFILDVLDDKKN